MFLYTADYGAAPGVAPSEASEATKVVASRATLVVAIEALLVVPTGALPSTARDAATAVPGTRDADAAGAVALESSSRAADAFASILSCF